MNNKKPQPRSDSDLYTVFQELNANLLFQCTAFDTGKTFIGPTIATIVSTLAVGFRSGDASLLERLGLGHIKLKTLAPVSEKTIEESFDSSLITIDLMSKCGVSPYLSIVRGQYVYLGLDDWLNTPAHYDPNSKTAYTRKEILDLLRNKQGGAHVDKKLSSENRGKLKKVFHYNFGEANDHAKLYSCARQIAHEYLLAVDTRDTSLGSQKNMYIKYAQKIEEEGRKRRVLVSKVKVEEIR